MRKVLLYITILTTGILFIGRLFYLQVVDTSLAIRSQDNAIKVVYDYPQRGYIYDRDGELMVSNQPSYDVMVIPRNLKPFDTTEFCKILNLSREDLEKKLDKARIYSPMLPSVVIPQLTKSEYAILQEKMRNYEGFYIQKRSLRDYQVDHSANVLGYIAEVNQKKVNENPYYISGDLIGQAETFQVGIPCIHAFLRCGILFNNSAVNIGKISITGLCNPGDHIQRTPMRMAAQFSTSSVSIPMIT